jgi:hypothetical protein
MDRTKIKKLAIIFFCCYFLASCFASSVNAEDNDTGFSSNILPNAGDTTSSYSNADLDGVTTGSSSTTLTNNLVYNGFTITCDTQVSNACGSAHPSIGEIEASHDLTVTATGSLVGITGNSDPDGVSHTSTQIKLNGGINLNSSVSVQNCEWSSSDYRCGSYSGAVDSYTITMKIKDSDGNVLASSTKIRTDDAGYNANARTFTDSLNYNGVHANTYEWAWKGVDGSGSTSSALRGPNLLGAEMKLDFPTDDYEPLSTAEIKSINESLGTANLNESEIWNVISGLEESIGEKLNVETEGAVVSVEINEETMQVIVHTSKEASVKEVAKVQEVVQVMNETKAVETLKKEVIREVMQEINEEPKTTQTKSFSMVSKEKAVSSKKEEPKVSKAPPGMKPSKEEKPVEKAPTSMVQKGPPNEKKEEPKEKEETKEEKSASETTSESTTETANREEQEGVQSEKTQVSKLELVMKKVDAKVKNPIKNLEIKNLIKLDIMMGDKDALLMYQNAVFYQPKDIYLEQLNIFDPRQIYDNVSLASYIKTDKVAIKANILHELNLKKQRLLIELEQLKNG